MSWFWLFSWFSSISISTNPTLKRLDSRHFHRNESNLSLNKVWIPVIPVKFGVISGAFLVLTWFYLFLGGYFYQFKWVHFFVMAYFMIVPVRMIKWIHFQRPPRKPPPVFSRSRFFKCYHIIYQSLYFISKLFCTIFFRTVIFISTGFTYVLMFKEILLNCEVSSNPLSSESSHQVTIDSNLVNHDLIAPIGLFSAPLCYMDGYDLSGVVQAALNSSLFDTGESFTLVFDSGTSTTLTSNRSDFTQLSSSKGPGKVVQGIAEGLDIEGSGKVQYALTDQNGSQAILQCDAYLVPKLHPNLHLISPQGIKTNKGDKATFTIHTLDEAKNDPTLEIKPNGPDWINAKPIHVIPVKFDPRSNLPVALARLPEDNHYGEFSFCAASQSQEIESKLNATVCLTEEANANLTSSQKELLRWHYKLGHVSFRQIQWLIRNKKLSTIGSYKAVANCTIPKCASCEFGKASRRPT